MADHNDPNAVNSIFSDIDVSAADLYDIFGFPSADTSSGEKVVIALTFASVPQAGVFDSDMLYRIRIATDRRLMRPTNEEPSLDRLLAYLEEAGSLELFMLQAGEYRRRWSSPIKTIGRIFALSIFRAAILLRLSIPIGALSCNRQPGIRSKPISAAETMLFSTI